MTPYRINAFMSNTLQLFRSNTGLMVITGLILFGSLVLGLVALLMMRSGASLRPIWFVAGFMAIIIGPQAFFHYGMAFGWLPKQDLTWVPKDKAAGAPWVARNNLMEIKGGRFTDPVAVYGPTVDTTLITNLRERLGPVFGTALAAEMAILRTGRTVVLAQFETSNDAESAAVAYATAMLGAVPPMDNDGTRTVNRVQDAVKLVVAGRTMVAYTARDVGEAEAALKESPVVTRAEASAVSDATDAPKQETFWLYRVPVLVAMILILMIIAVIYFFRGTSWAAEVPAVAGVSPVSAATLRERILSVNSLDVPFKVEVSPDDSNLITVTWRYADAKWIDLARAHGIRRTHRILMKLDEKNATVRPTDRFATMDWNAGAGGGSFSWMSGQGIVFFQAEYQKVFGLQLDANNRFTPKLSYSYSFNLQEMKTPFIQAVTQSGWRWRPTTFQGPTWLHWLTQ
ncbi:MAG: hypothetical protein ACO1Q7_03880 [Gemmatimonas sp.]